MKKAGIITLIDFYNLGNRLQNYAVQEFLKEQGIDAYTILRDEPYPYNNLKNKIKNIYFTIYEKLGCIHSYDLNVKFLWYKMYEFTKKNIKLSQHVIMQDRVPQDIDYEYEMFFVGSDQVWNPNTRNFSKVNFLEFTKKEKRNSISASFGIETIREEQKVQFEKWISSMNNISVREEKGQKLVEELTNKKATLLLDPTMFLSKEKWIKIGSKKKITKKPYAVTFFLGEFTRKQYEVQINNIINNNKLKNISILDLSDEKSNIISPDEFVSMINGAELILTDSFHGTVFSIIMKKPFILFDRKDNMNSRNGTMSSRTETLLKKFKLKDRTIESVDKENIFSVDFSETEDILREEKEKAVIFVKNILKKYR